MTILMRADERRISFSQTDLRQDRELVDQLKRERRRPLLSPSDGQVRKHYIVNC